MRCTADITLINNSNAGMLPKVFAAQTIESEAADRTIAQGVDGHLSAARHPSTVKWFGGSAADLTGVTRVQIISDGVLLFDAELFRNFELPSDFSGGVQFQVLA